MTKTSFLTLLAAVLVFGEAGQKKGLWCYSCVNERTAENCKRFQKCAKSDSYCVTSVIRAESGEAWFSKGCSPHCSDDRVDAAPPKPVLTQCCRTSFCNGSTSVRTSQLAVGILAGFLYVFHFGW
ncbi:fulgimotoxin-like [Heteronotia binoei]|uniref:fulgimotoxin-like n=1 Tax=Heteronotia binoei TaxID=13085 RepID=UPI00292DDF67|nr:fulgimotoxin-like [Heteronotia binoei]